MQRTLLLFAIFSLASCASIFDLLSWDFGYTSEVEKRDETSGTTQNCTCNGPSCICCIDFNFTYIDLGGPGCIQMKYISQEEGIAVNVSYGKSLIHSEKVKGPNPEPTCVTLLENLAQICAKFSHLHPIDNGLNGCLHLEPKLLGNVQAQFSMGCFTIDSKGMKLDSTANDNSSESQISNIHEDQTEESNEADLIAQISETAEQGLAFFGNFFGFFEKSESNVINNQSVNSHTT